MSALRQTELLTPEEYLAGEALATERHEYLAGVVYCMAGGSSRHARIIGNCFTALHTRLRGKRCQPFNSEMKVRVHTLAGSYFYYPDVSVSCQPVPDADVFYDTPTVIIEVVSPSSETTDHREKRLIYRHIPTLTSYIIVEQETRALTVWRRTGETWRNELIEGPDALLPLPELECNIPLAEIYEGISEAE